MQIEVLYDPYGIGKAAELDLSDPGDYWFARKAIEDARREGRPLSVRVRTYSMVGWFDDLTDEPGILVQLLDPLEELRKALGVDSLPPGMGGNAGLVISLSLIDRARDTPRFASEDAHSWLVRVLLGPHWCRESIDEEALSDVIAELALLGSEDAFVTDLRAQRLSHWEKTSSSLATLLKWLKHQPAQHARAFAVAQAVWTYPRDKVIEWLVHGNLLPSLAKLPKWEAWIGTIPSSLGSKESSITVPPSIAVEVNEFILGTAEQDGIRAVLERITGQLDVETTALRKVVRSYWDKRRIVSQDDVDLAKVKLGGIPEADALIEALEVLLPKEPPPPLSTHAPWEQVARWLIDEYLPYYAHVTAAGRVEDTELQVNAFEEWLLSNYLELHTRDSCLVHTYPQMIKQVLAEGPVLAVVIDGLGLTFQHRLGKALGGAGLYVLAMEPRLSLVPTLTEASKRAMLAGRSPQQLEPGSTEPEACAETLARAVGIAPEDVYATSDRQEGVESVCLRDARLYLYLVNEFDAKFAHSSLPPFQWSDQAGKYIHSLAQDIAGAANELAERTARAVTVVVSGDHGATELPEGHGWGIDIPANAEVTHGRVARVWTAPVPPEVVLLRAEPFMLREDIVVARGYHYFGHRPLGRTHGGMTPQEVAVPLVVASTHAPTDLKDLEVSIVGSVQRGRSDARVSLRAVNPNPYTAQIERLELAGGLEGVVQSTNQRVEPNSSLTFDLYVDASRVRDATVTLRIHVCWRIAGQCRSAVFERQVSTSGAAVADRSFEDLFGGRL